MSGHNVDDKIFNYFEMDKEMEKIYPINPLKESRITDDEIKKRKNLELEKRTTDKEQQ